MPEGDTIHTIAAVLRGLVLDRRVERCQSTLIDGRPLVGQPVRSIDVHGKHLLMNFGPRHVLRSHLGMYGSWHQYGRDETWRMPARLASVVLGFDGWDLVCFKARQLELLQQDEIRALTLAQRIGPDLISLGVEQRLPEIVRRAWEFLSPRTPLIDVLLDQRVSSGLGNVYKSELLFLEGLAPLSSLRETDAGQLRALFERGAKLLRQNVGSGPRRTRFERDGLGRYWVYERGGNACFHCGTPIRHARLGLHHRVTFWCPTCQRSVKKCPAGGSASGS